MAKEAFNDLQMLLRIDPDNVEGNTLVGIFLFENGKF